MVVIKSFARRDPANCAIFADPPALVTSRRRFVDCFLPKCTNRIVIVRSISRDRKPFVFDCRASPAMQKFPLRNFETGDA